MNKPEPPDTLDIIVGIGVACVVLSLIAFIAGFVGVFKS